MALGVIGRLIHIETQTENTWFHDTFGKDNWVGAKALYDAWWYSTTTTQAEHLYENGIYWSPSTFTEPNTVACYSNDNGKIIDSNQCTKKLSYICEFPGAG